MPASISLSLLAWIQCKHLQTPKATFSLSVIDMLGTTATTKQAVFHKMYTIHCHHNTRGTTANKGLLSIKWREI